MNYKRIYKQIVENAKAKSDDRKIGYYEKHHIIPDFMFKNRSRKGPSGHLPGNPNHRNNIVRLTAREHILCHVLLYKILDGTQYYYKAKSALMWFYTKVIGEHPRTLQFTPGLSRKYFRYRKHGIEGISKSRKGKMPCVDSLTRQKIGSVEIDHPKVLSGEWVHHSKGIKFSEERMMDIKDRQVGNKNPSFSGISNEKFLETYIWLSIKIGDIPSFKFYRKWYFSQFKEEFPKSMSKFRYNHGKDLWPLIEESTKMKYIKTQKWSIKLKETDYVYDKD